MNKTRSVSISSPAPPHLKRIISTKLECLFRTYRPVSGAVIHFYTRPSFRPALSPSDTFSRCGIRGPSPSRFYADIKHDDTGKKCNQLPRYTLRAQTSWTFQKKKKYMKAAKKTLVFRTTYFRSLSPTRRSSYSSAISCLHIATTTFLGPVIVQLLSSVCTFKLRGEMKRNDSD